MAGLALVLVLARASADEPKISAPCGSADWPWSGDFEPEHGVYSGGVPDPYHLALSRALLPGEPQRLCQLLTLPALGSERVVYFTRGEDGVATVVSRRLREALWPRLQAELARQAGTNSYDVGVAAQERALARLSLAVDEASAPLAAASAVRLSVLCRDVLLRVRYPAPPPENSGRSSEVSYHAAHWVPGMFLSGTTSWAAPGSVAEHLIVMEQSLERYVRSSLERREEQHVELLRNAEALARRLARARGRGPTRPQR